MYYLALIMMTFSIGADGKPHTIGTSAAQFGPFQTQDECNGARTYYQSMSDSEVTFRGECFKGAVPPK